MTQPALLSLDLTSNHIKIKTLIICSILWLHLETNGQTFRFSKPETLTFALYTSKHMSIIFLSFVFSLQSFFSTSLFVDELLQIVTCDNKPLNDNMKEDEKGREKNKGSVASCPHDQCMDVWSEQMPLSWIDSTNYLHPLPDRTGPTWNIVRDVFCLVNSKSPHNLSETNSCFCHLPHFSPQSFYSDYSLTRSLFFGDSTIRNFEYYLRSDLNRLAYVSLIRDPPFLVSYLKSQALLFPPKPFDKLENYSLSLVELDQQMRSLHPPSGGIWHHVTESSKSQCLNVSLSRDSVIKYVQEAYEDLDESHVPYYSTAVENCNAHPDRLLLFVVSGGLHYLTVWFLSLLCRTVTPLLSLSLLLVPAEEHRFCSPEPKV
jgi:hypothetical protein